MGAHFPLAFPFSFVGEEVPPQVTELAIYKADKGIEIVGNNHLLNVI